LPILAIVFRKTDAPTIARLAFRWIGLWCGRNGFLPGVARWLVGVCFRNFFDFNLIERNINDIVLAGGDDNILEGRATRQRKLAIVLVIFKLRKMRGRDGEPISARAQAQGIM